MERRAPEPAVYTPAQLLGRKPIRLRRRKDKIRLGAHLAVVVGLIGLSLWWVIPLHAFAGPVLVSLSRDHGVHAGDLPTLLFGAVALRSLVAACRLVAPVPLPAQGGGRRPSTATMGRKGGATP